MGDTGMNVGRCYVPTSVWVDNAWDDVAWDNMAYHHVYMVVGIVTHRVTFWGREFYGEIGRDGRARAHGPEDHQEP